MWHCIFVAQSSHTSGIIFFIWAKVEDNIITAIEELEELESRARLGEGPSNMGIELKAKEIKFKIQGIFQDRLQVQHSGEIKLNWGDEPETKKDEELQSE